ncbi:hypothetical protein MAGR_17790 [Mycolicibacterium agri]|uniref:Uncharacterized protein n=1 Tax=Mycolicibacterium agri TaxID=36811 RepID=A0A7I9VZ68_MYCAG|nr:hypothetical protein [Mycolicibacterium agri]GFG50338.1 hypothetical protein MAGR_17790 [Mycolicibacterium agri]
MAADPRRCEECGAHFYGRSDAAYCCAACRQKAYRARKHRRSVGSTREEEFRSVIGQARRSRTNARETRRLAGQVRARAQAERLAAAEQIDRARASRAGLTDAH